MACLLFYRQGYKKWQGFYNALSSYFCTFLSLQPSPAQKLTVLLISDRAEKGKEEVLCMEW